MRFISVILDTVRVFRVDIHGVGGTIGMSGGKSFLILNFSVASVRAIPAPLRLLAPPYGCRTSRPNLNSRIKACPQTLRVKSLRSASQAAGSFSRESLP